MSGLDSIRGFLSRPVGEGDNRGLFVVVAIVVIAAAAALVVSEDQHPARRAPAPPAPVVVSAPPEVATPTATPTAAPPVVANAERAARAWLTAYLGWSYGRRPHPPRGVSLGPRPPVPPDVRKLKPRVKLLTVETTGSRADANAVVNDGPRQYGVHLNMSAESGSWRVVSVG